MTLRQRIRFYQQLAVLTRAGVPIRSSLTRLNERIRGREMLILNQKIGEGEPFGEALASAGFSPFESHLVTAGERSAQLDTVLQHLGDFWERQRQMYQALTGQLYYPIAVLIFSLLVGALIDYLMSSVGVAILHLLEALALYGGGGFALYALIRLSWNTDAAQSFWLAVPLVGRTLSTAYAYRWVTALRLEHGAGVPMPDAVADAWRASGYAGREALAQQSQHDLREGVELSTLMQRWKRLPRDWVDFVETGEVSGSLETAFANLEGEAGRTWDIAQKNMTTWVPKVIYFFALLVVAGQVFSMVYHFYQQQVMGPMSEINSMLGN